MSALSDLPIPSDEPISLLAMTPALKSLLRLLSLSGHFALLLDLGRQDQPGFVTLLASEAELCGDRARPARTHQS